MFVLRRSAILCATSLMWLINVKRAKDNKKHGILVSTALCSAASANLWRDYRPNSVRRTIDIAVARLTGVYYSWLFVRRWKREKHTRVGDVVHAVCTNTCYLFSSKICAAKENLALTFHSLFHVGVFKIQSRLLSG